MENVQYQQGNLLDPLFYNDFDLILCRNVLIYFQASLQNKVIGYFYNALKTEWLSGFRL